MNHDIARGQVPPGRNEVPDWIPCTTKCLATIKVYNYMAYISEYIHMKEICMESLILLRYNSGNIKLATLYNSMAFIAVMMLYNLTSV